MLKRDNLPPDCVTSVSQLPLHAYAALDHSLRSVRLLLHTSQYLRQQLAAASAAPASMSPEVYVVDPLSAREQEVMTLLVQGFTLPKIGEKLFISPATVNNHCARIREKLGIRGRGALMKYATNRMIGLP